MLYCVFLAGEGFPAEVIGPFKTSAAAYEWLKFNYGGEGGIVLRFRLETI